MSAGFAVDQLAVSQSPRGSGDRFRGAHQIAIAARGGNGCSPERSAPREMGQAPGYFFLVRRARARRPTVPLVVRRASKVSTPIRAGIRQEPSCASGSESVSRCSSDSDRRYVASASSDLPFPLHISREPTAVQAPAQINLHVSHRPWLGRQRLACRRVPLGAPPVHPRTCPLPGSAPPARSSIPPAHVARQGLSPCPRGR